MADLSCNLVGIRSPNPFWLASAPPTDKAYNVNRAFEAGWGGVVWKTLGEDPPIVNVSGPRYGALLGTARNLIGFNNIELITDRMLTDNLREIRQIKRDWPDRALAVSLMVPCEEAAWKTHPADGGGHRRRRHRAQLRLSARHVRARHGRRGRAGAGIRRDGDALVQAALAAAGDRQAHAERDQHPAARARCKARRRGCGVARQYDQRDHGGRSRSHDAEPAASTAAARTVAIAGPRSSRSRCAWSARSRAIRNRPACRSPGIGGIATWRDAAEFMALGAGNVQVCTAAMVYGFKIVEDMIDGLNNWMDRRATRSSAISSAKPCRNSSTGNI